MIAIGPFDFQPLTRVVFGIGSLDRLGEQARELGGRRALVVTDPGIVAAGHVERGVRSLEAAGLAVTVFDGVEENPTTRHVDASVTVGRRARIDLLVGLGGGSSMDTAKGTNFLFTNGGRMADYWGVGKATRPMLPMIAVPTTAGTGSEAQSFALIADEETHQKMACGDKKAACRVALLDPEVTVSQPPRVTAASGIDAVAHALESHVTQARTRISCMFSREAWELLRGAFPRVLADPADREARGRMLLGAHWAGAAIENSMLGATHSAANPLTARYGITHGVAIGIMLPHVVRFNASACDGGYQELVGSPAGQRAGDWLADRVSEYRRRAGLPVCLADCGVERSAIPELAQEAASQWTAQFNPRPVDVGDFIQLYEAAYERS